MKYKILLACSFSFSCLSLSSATVGVDSGAGADFLIFQTASGTPLNGGFFSVGVYDGSQSVGLSFFDVSANFTVFGSRSTASGTFGVGDFDLQTFDDNVEGTVFAGQQIYVLVTNSDVSEFAFFTADNNIDWQFPTVNDGGIDPNANDATSISFSQINNILVGTELMSDPDGGGPFGTFNTIQLAAIPEPSTVSFLGLLAATALLRRRRQ